jgi:hypothetical protein
VIGFEYFRKNIDLDSFNLLSYIHSKGVTKTKNKNIWDWTMMMKYFIVDRLDLCKEAFDQGAALYGTNIIYDWQLCPNAPSSLIKVPFHFSGNFVSLNLRKLRQVFMNTEIESNYFGVEAFWGKLCKIEEVRCIHKSSVENHYESPYPIESYREQSSERKSMQMQNG